MQHIKSGRQDIQQHKVVKMGNRCQCVLEVNIWAIPDLYLHVDVVHPRSVWWRPVLSCTCFPSHPTGEGYALSARILSVLVQVWGRTEVIHTPSSTDRGSNSWPPDHDSAFHVTETPALTTRPSVTSWTHTTIDKSAATVLVSDNVQHNYSHTSIWYWNSLM